MSSIDFERGAVCNISPFNSQYNAMAIEYSRMRAEGATEQQLKDFASNYCITSREGQWSSPVRLPTSEENLQINAEIIAEIIARKERAR